MARLSASAKQNDLIETARPSVGAPYLCFVVDGRSYAIDVQIVREVRRWSEPTPLPDSPRFVRGAINLRGTIIPVYDLKERFGDGPTTPGHYHVLIVVAHDDKFTGLLVDAVSDLVEIDLLAIQKVDEANKGADCFVDSIAIIDDRVVAILGIGSVVLP